MIWCCVALGFEPVTTTLTRSAVLNWTEMRIEITAIVDPAGAQGIRATEEVARRTVDGHVEEAVLRVPIDPDRTLEDLRVVPELWSQIQPRIRRWVEIENQYYTSGRVGVVGALPLVGLLKPLTMATAAARPQARAATYTGLVLDTRGAEIIPCFAPSIRGPAGELYDGRLSLEAASERANTIWVADAADPAAARAGKNPLLVHSTQVQGCVLTVGASEAAAIEALVDAGVLADGTTVIVVD